MAVAVAVAVAVAIRPRRASVHARHHVGVLRCYRQRLSTVAAHIDEAVSYILGQLWFWQLCNLLLGFAEGFSSVECNAGRAAVLYLKRLCVPIGNSLNRRHLIQAVGELVELLDAVRQADGQLFTQKLGASE